VNNFKNNVYFDTMRIRRKPLVMALCGFRLADSDLRIPRTNYSTWKVRLKNHHFWYN